MPRTAGLAQRDTHSARPGEVERRWYVVDAEEQVLGRLASRVANLLRGKGKALFTPHVDVGDFVIVVNAAKIRLTGRKLEQKRYYRHSGWAGGLRSLTAEQLLESRFPERAVQRAVRGMLPKNALGRQLYRKLKVYSGPEHPHAAQKPEEISLG